MNKPTIVIALSVAVAAQVASAQPSPREIHEHVLNHLKAVRDVFVPAPVIDFVESFPPIARPRAHILQLAQADQEPFEVPVPPEPIDPTGIANFAHDFAVNTTQRVLDGFFPRGGGPRRPVIVGGEIKNADALAEDLSVMQRILEKAAGAKADGPATASGIELLSFNRPTSPRAFYLDGYGAMFLLNVKFPLVAPPKKDEQSRTNETNSEWEKAREEVYGSRNAFDDVKRLSTAGEEFDAQRVENLKAQLIEDLANAKNIRNLKSDDYVTVVVLGGGSRGTVVRRETSPRAGGAGFGGGGLGGGGGGRGGAVARVEVSSSSVETGAQSTMTLRAKKSDIDAFAKGKLDAPEFQKKVAVQIY